MASPDPRSPLASSQKRALAYVLDLCAAALLLAPAAFATYVLDTPGAGGAEFAALFFAYHAYFLGFKRGVSLGKYVQNIAVVSRDGGPLRLPQVLARAALLSVPWALFALDVPPGWEQRLSFGAGSVLPVLAACWLLFDVLLMDMQPTRRSLTDHLARTVVVNLPPPQPHRAPATPMYSATDAEFGTPPRRPPAPPPR